MQPNQITGGIFHNYLAVPKLPPSVTLPRYHASQPSRSQASDFGLSQGTTRGRRATGNKDGASSSITAQRTTQQRTSADFGRVQMEHTSLLEAHAGGTKQTPQLRR